MLDVMTPYISSFTTDQFTIIFQFLSNLFVSIESVVSYQQISQLSYFQYLSKFIIYMNKNQLISKLLILCVALAVTHCASIYDQYYQEAKRITEGMTLDQKIGQTIQADIQFITNRQKNITDPDQAVKFNLGSLLISGNAAPTNDGNLAKIPWQLQQEKVVKTFLQGTQQNWKKLADRLMNVSVKVTSSDKKNYQIKFLLGTDAVHGDQHTVGKTLFPHNIGLSCSKNPAHYKNIGFWTQDSVKKSGFNYAFAPTVAVSHNPQWGRFYQTNGQNQSLIKQCASNFVEGLQAISNGKINGVLGSAKHFLGDGSTMFGANQGTSRVYSFKKYVDHNSQGYAGAIDKDIGSVMISYSAINGVPMSFNSYFLLGTLRDDLGFKGFTISDYDDILKAETMNLPRTFMNVSQDRAYALMVSAGTDMIMLSGNHFELESTVGRIIKQAKKNVQKGLLREQRLNEAVTRILQVKLAMGLAKQVSSEPKEPIQNVQIPETSSGDQYKDSLDAVHQSLVLLKNQNVLPAKSLFLDIKYVVLIGQKVHNVNRLNKFKLFRNYDNIGMQCGGWSVAWQGREGNQFWSDQNKKSSKASSILDALLEIQKVNKFQIIMPTYKNIDSQIAIDEDRRSFIEQLKKMKKSMNSKNTIIIGAFGEFPYAESVGDVNIPYCKEVNHPGCTYNPAINTYAPVQQPKTLQIVMSKFQGQVYDQVKTADKNIPLVSVLFSGRPLLIQKLLDQSSAMIAAWLPGTSGGKGVVDAIAGQYIMRPNGQSDIVNTLSMDWPRTMTSLESFPTYDKSGEVPKIDNPLFGTGYGLSSFTGSNLKEIKSQTKNLEVADN